MKRLLLLAIAFIFSTGIASAQEVFAKNDIVFNAGIGLGSTLYTGTGYKTTFPPLSVFGEYCVADNLIFNENGSIGVGGYLGFSSAKHTTTLPSSKYGWKYNSVILGARGTFHFQFVRNLDTYAGLGMGYNVVSSKSFGNNPTSTTAAGSKFSWDFFIGARYFFADYIGAFAELGYGIAYFNLGVTFKL